MVKWGDDANAKSYKIIGVIKDMLMQSPYEPVKQTIYFLDYENVNWIVLKLNPIKALLNPFRKSKRFLKNIFLRRPSITNSPIANSPRSSLLKNV